MKKYLALFLLLLVFTLGCKNLITSNDYPISSSQVTKAFLKKVEVGDFGGANKYTNNIKFNGASYEILQTEVRKLKGKPLVYPIDIKKEQVIIDTKKKGYNRLFTLKKINNKWKITSTKVDEDVKFKDLTLLVSALERKDYNMIVSRENFNRLMKLYYIFKDKQLIIRKPKLKSIFDKTLDLKIYAGSYKHGVIIRCYGNPAISSWKWKIFKQF